MNQPRKNASFKLGCVTPFVFFLIGSIGFPFYLHIMSPHRDVMLCTEEEMNKLSKEQIENIGAKEELHDCYIKRNRAWDYERSYPVAFMFGGLSTCFAGSMILVIGNKISKKIRKDDA